MVVKVMFAVSNLTFTVFERDIGANNLWLCLKLLNYLTTIIS